MYPGHTSKAFCACEVVEAEVCNVKGKKIKKIMATLKLLLPISHRLEFKSWF